MNDRFGAQLRQHLLNSADERPADGQMAAVVDVVAVTPQRPSLVARLTWFPGLIGPFPSTALRYGLVALALVAATVGAAILGGGSTRPPSAVFEGTWTSIDPADNSTQTLVVGAGRTPVVHFEDAFATGAACIGDAVKRFTADGTGEISGDRLDVSFPDGGGCGLRTVAMKDGSYDYHEATDTLVDGQNLTWSRVVGGVAPPTRAPVTSPPGEATFSSTIHGISIDYPDGWRTRPATEPWAGGALSFGSPAADVIFDPKLGDRLYLVVASQPYGDLSQAEWRDEGIDWLCTGDGMAGGSWTVDGADASVIECTSTRSAAFIFTDTRGYLIRLVVSSDEPGLAETYDFDWLKPVLETVDLRPEEALDAPSPAGAAPIGLTEEQIAAAVPGNWAATDAPPDSSHLTMEVVGLPGGSYDVTIRDDYASVCDGASSTMTGVAEAQEPGTIVIAQPDYVCDDGSEAHALSGPPLDEQLKDLGFTYNPVSDQLQDSGGLIWSRVEAAQ